VKDNLTGLIWLKNPNCFGLEYWHPALSDVSTLASGACGLTDGSVAGDWRLPNVKELQSLIDFSQVDPALPPGHPFSGVGWLYWSSTTAQFPDHAWYVSLGNGLVSFEPKGLGYHNVWPVRGGQ
jgi:hypothetical protein